MSNRDENVLPVLAGLATAAGGGLLVWTLLRRQAPSASRTPAPPRSPARSLVPTASRAPSGDDWQWPIPIWKGRSPVISDGWGSRRRTLDGKPRTHQGVDLMYPRASLDDMADAFPPNTAGGSKWHFMPEHVPVLAARAGRVTYAERTPRGIAIVVRHPDGWSTFYQHLATLRVARGEDIETGQILGEVGGDPTQRPALRHLHFEIRRPGGNAIDPRPLLRTWPRVELFVVDDGIASITHPPPRHA